MIPYGKMFYAGEVILVYVNEEPTFFARVEEVMPDQRKGWWNLTFTMLTIPLQRVTWILDDEQMRGQNFTMNGVPMQISRVEAPDAIRESVAEEAPTGTSSDSSLETSTEPNPAADLDTKESDDDIKSSGEGNVISLFDQD